MYPLYRIATYLTAGFFLKKRIAKGKEDAKRVGERMGETRIKRPRGKLVWMHGASVGEVTSLLTLVDRAIEFNPRLTVLITSGTQTSAEIIAKRDIEGVIHQYVPLDHPNWVKRFFDHWKPDAAIIAESEIWPNIVNEIGKRKIPAVLVNARLSEKSYNNWRKLRGSIRKLLDSFGQVLTQTDTDTKRYQDLGHKDVMTCGNIKYSSPPLKADEDVLKSLQNKFKGRPIWVYASSHADEESMACDIHRQLQAFIPNILTVIVPRHPERRQEIADACDSEDISLIFRSAMRTPPENTDVYVVDTLGELGLFYRLADIAVIGRTFSKDGGGGHNPIEAAQLECATLHGPLYQNQQEIFDEMHAHNAATQIKNAEELYEVLFNLFMDEEARQKLIQNALNYTNSKDDILNAAFKEIVKILPPSIEDGSENDSNGHEA